MINRKTTIDSPETIVSNNLSHKPSISQSIYNNLALGFTTPSEAILSFNKEYADSPRGQSAKAFSEAVKMGNNNPEVGWTQWGANELSNMTGQFLNPFTWIFGELGGVAAKPISYGVSKVLPQGIKAIVNRPVNEILSDKVAKYIPSTLGKKGGEETLSLALFGKQLTKGFTIGAGVALPQELIDNFNYELNQHDILGIAKGLSINGGFGMSISTIPFMWGIAKANYNRSRGKLPSEAVTKNELTQSLKAGYITKEEHDDIQELLDYLSQAENKIKEKGKISASSTKALSEKNHSVDHANDTAQVELMSKSDLENFQAATVDHLVSDFIPEEHRNALTNFTVKNSLDKLKDKPELIDGLRGYVEYMDNRVTKSEELINKANQLVTKSLESNKIHSDLINELINIEEKLIEKNKLIENVKSNENYLKLSELSEVYNPAKMLMDRIDLEYALNEQGAYRDLAKTIIDMADKDTMAIVSSDPVKDYLEARTKEIVEPKPSEKIKEEVERVDKEHNIPQDSEAILSEQEKLMENIEDKEIKKSYESAKQKYDEFKGREKVFSNLIQCVLGNENG